MQIRGGGQPRHQCHVFDGIPPPVAAPSQDVIRPPHAEDKARALQRPGQQREPARMSDPGGVGPSCQQGRRSEAERNGEGRESSEHDGRVDEHPAVTKHGIEAETVRRHDTEQVEGARHNYQHHQEESEDRSENPGGIAGKAKAEP